MDYLMSHLVMLLSVVLVVSEAAAAVVQLLFPGNAGISGFLAGLIKFLQSLGAKDPGQPPSA